MSADTIYINTKNATQTNTSAPSHYRQASSLIEALDLVTRASLSGAGAIDHNLETTNPTQGDATANSVHGLPNGTYFASTEAASTTDIVHTGNTTYRSISGNATVTSGGETSITSSGVVTDGVIVATSGTNANTRIYTDGGGKTLVQSYNNSAEDSVTIYGDNGGITLSGAAAGTAAGVKIFSTDLIQNPGGTGKVDIQGGTEGVNIHTVANGKINIAAGTGDMTLTSTDGITVTSTNNTTINGNDLIVSTTSAGTAVQLAPPNGKVLISAGTTDADDVKIVTSGGIRLDSDKAITVGSTLAPDSGTSGMPLVSRGPNLPPLYGYPCSAAVFADNEQELVTNQGVGGYTMTYDFYSMWGGSTFTGLIPSTNYCFVLTAHFGVRVTGLNGAETADLSYIVVDFTGASRYHYVIDSTLVARWNASNNGTLIGGTGSFTFTGASDANGNFALSSLSPTQMIVSANIGIALAASGVDGYLGVRGLSIVATIRQI